MIGLRPAEAEAGARADDDVSRSPRSPRSLRPLPLPLVLAGGGALVAVGLLTGLATGSLTFALAPFGLLALAGAAYLSVWAPPSLFFSLAIAFSVYSRYDSELGLPIGPDRVFLAAALGSMVLGLPGFVRQRAIVWRPVHAVLGLVAAYAAVSAFAGGKLSESDGIFAVLDRLGLIPFLAFTLAPLVFGSAKARNTLLVCLTVLGGYLAITSFAEALDLKWLIWPGYIDDPSVGIHYGRSRGPFGEAVAMGIALYGCAVAAAVAAFTWTTRRSRVLAGLVVVGCLAGTIFTLTRAVWLATIVATGLSLLANRRTRSLLGPAVVVGAVVLVAALAFVPQFADQADERASEQRPLWDRFNTNRAALAMVRDEPLFGVGWQRFREESPQYLELSDDYPLTGSKIEVHNVFLSHAAELGLVGASLWTAGLLLAVAGATVRPGPASLDPWRLAMVALFVHWLVCASFGPLSYAFPNLLLWAWAGIAGMGHTSEALERPRLARAAAAPAAEPVIVLP